MSGADEDALAVVARPEGLYVPALDLFLDPGAPVPRAFVSHARPSGRKRRAPRPPDAQLSFDFEPTSTERVQRLRDATRPR